MIGSELPALHSFRCANPECPSRRTGRGQIIMRGENVVGWRGEGRCHQCGFLTTITVEPDGPEYHVRPHKSNQ